MIQFCLCMDRTLGGKYYYCAHFSEEKTEFYKQS